MVQIDVFEPSLGRTHPREFLLRLPMGYDSAVPLPLVIDIHGASPLPLPLVIDIHGASPLHLPLIIDIHGAPYYVALRLAGSCVQSSLGQPGQSQPINVRITIRIHVQNVCHQSP